MYKVINIKKSESYSLFLKYVVIFLLLFFPIFGKAQSTYSTVYAIFQAKCAIACHTSGNPSGQLVLDGNEAMVYQAIVNVSPINLTALNKGDKLIAPGYPEKSFLFRKCNNNWDPYYELDPSEGNPMPNGQNSLSAVELETLRQWILFGAPEQNVVVNDSTLIDYYGGMGITNVSAPPPPSPSEGLQVRLGPFFLENSSEVEHTKKHNLILPDTIEVNRIDVFMNPTSHHLLVSLLDENDASITPEGFRIAIVDFSKMLISTQYSNNFALPPGTAYELPKNSSLDISYHMVNYDPDSVLMADVYLNVYTQPKGTAQKKMYSKQLDINYSGLNFMIPNNSNNITFSDSINIFGSSEQWNIWLLSSHTHQWGIDFDIYKRNADGSKGTQLYEGFYNTDYSFNQGYYDWAHPAIRFFDPLETINISEGLIQEATFKNMGVDTAFVGPTANNEMMSIVIQYTTGSSNTGVLLPDKQKNSVKISPNPFKDYFTITYSLIRESKIEICLYNFFGDKIQEMEKEKQLAGNYQYQLQDSNIPPGVYFVKVIIGGETYFSKVIKL